MKPKIRWQFVGSLFLIAGLVLGACAQPGAPTAPTGDQAAAPAAEQPAAQAVEVPEGAGTSVASGTGPTIAGAAIHLVTQDNLRYHSDD